MINYMKKLTEVLLGVENMSDDVRKYQDQMTSQINYINNELNITHKDYRLRTIENGVFMAPVTMPCIINTQENKTPKFDFVYFGLNPGYSDEQYLEKEAAHKYDGGYFSFYNSYGINDFLLKGKMNTYYQRVMKVIYALFQESNKETVSIQDVRAKFGYDKLTPVYKNDHLVFRELTKDMSLAFPELIPYHSRKFGESLDMLKDKLESLSVYNNYLDEVLLSIENNLSDDGIVVANGRPVLELLEGHIIDKQARLIHEDVAIKVYKIRKNLWVMFKRQLGAQDFELNISENMKMFGDKIKELRSSENFQSVAKNNYISKKCESSEVMDDMIKETYKTFEKGESMVKKSSHTYSAHHIPFKINEELSIKVYDYLIDKGLHVHHGTNKYLRCNPKELKNEFPEVRKWPALHFEIVLRSGKMKVQFLVDDVNNEKVKPFVDEMIMKNVDPKLITAKNQRGVFSKSIKNEEADEVIKVLDQYFDTYTDRVLKIFNKI
ncbi:hypothetical protein EZV73_09825 [Acidaminobacter sp. JC074]|uniref:hypothetical protein n=1 Tax=Acidaminobacter sp. JC074 TaxID=2530199 RepID=UPI001F0D1900|nr:hypothetical protein [Acidaminobacter sp. JC074]MCH4887872.1 hypothetical protein [Acidaminobacter sp. JC074]